MDSNTSNFSGHCPGSGSQADTQNFVFDINESLPHLSQCFVSPYRPRPQEMSIVPHIALQQLPPVHNSPGLPYSPNQYYRQPYTGTTDGPAEDEVQEVDASQVPEVGGKKKGLARRGKSYEPEEDRVLCSTWLNTTLDAVTGTNQDKTSFYKRMHKYFLENYDNNSKRSENSIQQRWSTISRCVSKFCAILGKIERLNQSGTTFQDWVNDAIKEYQEKEPWHFHHCWEVLRDEPKWNNRVLETSKSPREKANIDVAAACRETEVQYAQDVPSPPARLEGRDSVKCKRIAESGSSSVAVDMLQKLHDRGQQMDEVDSKHKEEMINLEKAKFELQQKQWQAKFDMIQEANRLQRELTQQTTQEQLKLQREMTEAQLKVQVDSLEVERRKCDSQIMFTDVTKLNYPLREWVLRGQVEILARDGIEIGSGSQASKEN